MIDENLAHRLAGSPVKVPAALPIDRTAAHQLEVGLVHQSRGLQRVAGAFLLHSRLGDPSQLVVDQRQQLGLAAHLAL